MSQVNQSVSSLLKTTVAVDPVAVVFNVTSSMVEQFVEEYFRSQGIDGLVGVRCIADRASTRPEIMLYAFFNLDSKDIVSKVSGLAPRLQQKMDVGNLRASEELFKAARPLVKDFGLEARPNEKLAILRLNIFRALGLMLSSDYRSHRLTIHEVQKLSKKEFAMSVIKATKFVAEDGSYDRFTDIAYRISDRD